MLRIFPFPLARMQTLVGMNYGHQRVQLVVGDGQGIEGYLAFLALPTTCQGLPPQQLVI